jgi:hypothetical protein
LELQTPQSVIDFLPAGGALWAEAETPAIIPLPQKMEVQPGSFVLRAHGHLLGAGTKIVANLAQRRQAVTWLLNCPAHFG